MKRLVLETKTPKTPIWAILAFLDVFGQKRAFWCFLPIYRLYCCKNLKTPFLEKPLCACVFLAFLTKKCQKCEYRPNGSPCDTRETPLSKRGFPGFRMISLYIVT